MTNQPMPSWLLEVKSKYRDAIAHVFVIHGNVNDYALPGYFVTSILAHAWSSMECIVFYDRSAGFTFPIPSHREKFIELSAPPTPAPTPGLPQAALAMLQPTQQDLPRDVLPALQYIERALRAPGHGHDGTGEVVQGRVLVIIQYAETLVPHRDWASMSPEDRTAIVTVRRWATDRQIASSGNVVVLVTRSLADLHRDVISPASKIEPVEVPYPDYQTRLDFINHQVETTGLELETGVANMARLTAGLPLILIEDIFLRAGAGPVSLAHIRDRKAEVIRTEYADLVEILEPDPRGLSLIGGYEAIKASLMRDVVLPLRQGDSIGAPMAIALVGVHGTGKTVLAKALAAECGFNVVQEKNIRSKWVGESEANLDRVQALYRTLEPVMIIHDEADREITPGNEGDQVSSRLYGKMLQEMSDTSRRGKRIHVFICNYPSRLPAAFWRPGRVDYRYPFFLPEPLERELVARALCQKYGFAEENLDFAALAAATQGYTGAQIERVLLNARNIAVRAGRDHPNNDDVEAALADYLHIDDATAAVLAQRIDLGHPELNAMTLEAIRHCSAWSLLPPTYADLVRSAMDSVRPQQADPTTPTTLPLQRRRRTN